MTAATLKRFMQDIPDHAQVIFNKDNITFISNGDTRALNKYGAVWDNGIGYGADGTTICGECSYFDCKKCKEEKD